jgi:hypothetical protein
MSRWNERDIARKLAERDDHAPPPGLLEQIKSEIPSSLRMDGEAPEDDPKRRQPVPPRSRERWLIAASLVAMVGAGLFALRVREQAPALEPSPRRAVAAPAPALPGGPAGEDRRPAAAPPPVPASPPPPSPAGPAAPEAKLEPAPPPAQAAKKDLAAGVLGGAPAAAAPPPPPVPAPAEAMREERREERMAVSTRSAPAAPGRMADRINVGGNEAGQQGSYIGPRGAGRAAAEDRPAGALAGKAAAQQADPFVDTARDRFSTLVLDVDQGSYAVARRDLEGGKLPDPRSVRVGDFVSVFSFLGDLDATALESFVIQAEGAPAPFAPGPAYQVLRFHLSGVDIPPSNTRLQVELNPEVVVRYRLLGDAGRAAAGEHGVTVLYEVELRPDPPAKGWIATLRLREPVPAARTLTLSELAPAWEGTSADFRLTVLAAELAEILKGSAAWANEDLSRVARQLREVAGQLPQGSRAAELAELAEKAARLRGAGGRP